MNEDEETPLTTSREALYELAWSKRMQELAKDFGISDVALAKRPVVGTGQNLKLKAPSARRGVRLGMTTALPALSAQ